MVAVPIRAESEPAWRLPGSLAIAQAMSSRFSFRYHDGPNLRVQRHLTLSLPSRMTVRIDPTCEWSVNPCALCFWRSRHVLADVMKPARWLARGIRLGQPSHRPAATLIA